MAASGVGGAWLIGCGGRQNNALQADTYWISAQGRADDNPGLVIAHPQTEQVHRVHTGYRGHDVAQHPVCRQLVVLFGRRPGLQSSVVDVHTRKIIHTLSPSIGATFQGHGFFTPDGQWLVTAEAENDTGQGRLVIRDTNRYMPYQIFPSRGVEPHQIRLMPDHRTVVIAHGGLVYSTSSENREIINLESMDSNLSYMDLKSGETLSSYKVDNSKASIRHIDVSADGTVAFGVQLQRAALDHEDVLPLAGFHTQGQDLSLLDGPSEVMAALQDYVGSVALNSAGDVAGFSSPRGDICMFWNLRSQELLGYHRLEDGCGLDASVEGQDFILSSSRGEVRVLSVDSFESFSSYYRQSDVLWDNHLLAMSFASP